PARRAPRSTRTWSPSSSRPPAHHRRPSGSLGPIADRFRPRAGMTRVRGMDRERDRGAEGSVSIDFAAVDIDAPLARVAVGHYFAELQRRFPDGFDAETEAAKDASGLRPPGGIFVVATVDGEPVACGGLQSLGDGIAEVKRMWVDPTRRGVGLGSRLLRHLESRAVGL